MTNYPIGDFLIQIKNAARAGRKEVVTDTSKLKVAVANVLKEEKLLDEVKVDGKTLSVRLTFHKKEAMLMDIKLVSKPGLRKYMSVDEVMGRRRRQASFLIISTPKGVMSSDKAMKQKTAGEVIAEIW